MNFNRFDRLVVFFLGVVLLLIVLLLWRGDRVGVQILSVTPQDEGDLSAWGRVGIIFKQPMQSESVEERFSIEPAHAGHFTWQENTLWFVPDERHVPGEVYRVSLSPGMRTADGRVGKKAFDIEFKIRSPQVIYLSNREADDYELYVADLQGGNRQLTHSGGKVYDYTVARDGERVVYTRMNALHGVDLWQVSRDGSQESLLLECGSDLCTQPAISPDGGKLAYTRQVSTNASPVLWLLSDGIVSNEMLFDGSSAVWSPDGRYLAALDSAQRAIRVIDLQTQQGIELESSWDTAAVWFPDASRMVYADMQAAAGLPYPLLYQLDVRDNHVSAFLPDALTDMEFSMPSVSPDGKQLVIAMRTVKGELTKQLWLMRVDGSEISPITNDKTFSNHSYHWDAQGERVLFQQVQLQEPEIYSRVMIWQRDSGELQQVVRDAALPDWLP